MEKLCIVKKQSLLEFIDDSAYEAPYMLLWYVTLSITKYHNLYGN